MSQADIIKLLEEEDRWMSSKEIGFILEISPGCVNSALNKMLKWNEVLKQMKINNTLNGPYLWKGKEVKEDE